MKTVPLRSSCFPDSGGIFIFANGIRMEKISRFDCQVKQAKIWDADCTCPYSLYGHVEGRTILLTWQRAWRICIGFGCPIKSGHVSLVANIVWTRGPTIWHHVSLYHWLLGWFIIV
jgi:hypothetical protein